MSPWWLRNSLTTQLIANKLDWNILFISQDLLGTVWNEASLFTPLNTSQPRAATRGSSEVKVCIWAARLSLKRLAVVAAAATTSLWHLSVLLPQMRKRKGRAEEDTNHGNKKAISSRTPDHQQLWKQKRNENNWAATMWSINTENTNWQYQLVVIVWLFFSVYMQHNRFIFTPEQSSSQAPAVHLITAPLRAFQINRSIDPSIDRFISM